MRPSLLIGLSAFAMCASAGAQTTESTVKIFGSLDDGLTYVSNQTGRSHLTLQDGVNKANGFGFMGTEDLGGGHKAEFKLEGGFSVNRGDSPPGQIFNKQAYVGLTDSVWGQLSFGRQYDFTALLARFLPCMQCGLFIVQNGDLDRLSGQRLNNSIQYQSQRNAGLKVGAMYALSEGSSSGRATSVTADYVNGPFSTQIAATELHGSAILAGKLGATSLLGQNLTPTSIMLVDKQRVVGVGAMYQIGLLRAKMLYTNTHLTLKQRSATDQVINLGADYQLTPAVLLQAKVSTDKLEDSRWNSVNAGIDYALSKHTDVYAEAAYQKASGPGTRASIPLTASPSSTNTQVVTRIGVRHLF